MKWTIGSASCVMYAVVIMALAIMASDGMLKLDLGETASWAVLAWLAVYPTIVVMLIGGSAHWLVVKKLGLMVRTEEKSHDY